MNHKNKEITKPVFFDGGNLSCGNASSIKEARDIAWEKLPDSIQGQIIKEDLKHMEFNNMVEVAKLVNRAGLWPRCLE